MIDVSPDVLAPVGPVSYTVVSHHRGYAVEQRIEPAVVANYPTMGQALRHTARLNAQVAALMEDLPLEWEGPLLEPEMPGDRDDGYYHGPATPDPDDDLDETEDEDDE